MPNGNERIYRIDDESYQRLRQAMDALEGNSGNIIADVMSGYGADEIAQNITAMLPRSGRNWKGKAKAAADAKPFAATMNVSELTLTTTATGKYRYLYFPDDGTTTERHAGEKHFMFKGAEASAENIIEKSIEKLLEAINERS